MITVEEAKGTETKPERMEAILEDAYILINEKKISSMKDLLPILEQIAKIGQAGADPGRGQGEGETVRQMP